jgi:hypothetical protein
MTRNETKTSEEAVINEKPKKRDISLNRMLTNMHKSLRSFLSLFLIIFIILLTAIGFVVISTMQ